MFIIILGFFFSVLFLVFSWYRWSWALFLFLAFLPTYLIRLEYWGLPTTVLEIMWGGLFLSWLGHHVREDWPAIRDFISKNIFFVIVWGIFFLASIVAIFISEMWFKSLGQWRAYFLEPMLLFIMLIGRGKKIDCSIIVGGLLSAGFLVASLAIIQKIIPGFYPPSLWNDNLNGRVTSFFTSPNAIGLFLAPLVPLAVVYIERFYRTKSYLGLIMAAGLVLLFLSAIFFSFSQGAWIGLFVGACASLWVIGYRKVTIGLAVVGILAMLIVPDLRSAIFFHDRAANNRVVLWRDSIDYLTVSSRQFVFGTGIRQFFRKIEKPRYDDAVMERLIYPHNFLLNFWTEIGLAGMLAMVGLLGVLGLWIKQCRNRAKQGLLMAIWVIFLVHGLVDVPYFKNDLAFLFWLLFFLTWHLKQIDATAVSLC